MPQPIRKECEVVLDGLYSLPEHAQVLGQIVSLSGHLESTLGYLLAYLSGASATVAIPMFNAVTSSDGQRAMLRAAAEQRLQGAELDEFTDLMAEFRTRYGERNRLVHNIWGRAPSHPEKAVWCHAKDYTRLPMQFAVMQSQDELPFAHQQLAEMWKHCSLYTLQDLHDVFNRLNAFTNEVRRFIMKLLTQHPVLGAQPPSGEPDEAPQGGLLQDNPDQSDQNDPE